MGVGTLAVLTATLAMNSGQWAVASGQCVTGVTLPLGVPLTLGVNSGQWPVASGQGVTHVGLPAGVEATASGAEPGTAREPQVKLDEQPADPAKEKAAAVSRARAHLAKRLGVEPGLITLESASAATWPDAALGCPEKDRMYAQVVTSGYKVILEVDGKKHEVHVAGSRAVICPASPTK